MLNMEQEILSEIERRIEKLNKLKIAAEKMDKLVHAIYVGRQTEMEDLKTWILSRLSKQ